MLSHVIQSHGKHVQLPCHLIHFPLPIPHRQVCLRPTLLNPGVLPQGLQWFSLFLLPDSVCPVLAHLYSLAKTLLHVNFPQRKTEDIQSNCSWSLWGNTHITYNIKCALSAPFVCAAHWCQADSDSGAAITTVHPQRVSSSTWSCSPWTQAPHSLLQPVPGSRSLSPQIDYPKQHM